MGWDEGPPRAGQRRPLHKPVWAAANPLKGYTAYFQIKHKDPGIPSEKLLLRSRSKASRCSDEAHLAPAGSAGRVQPSRSEAASSLWAWLPPRGQLPTCQGGRASRKIPQMSRGALSQPATHVGSRTWEREGPCVPTGHSRHRAARHGRGLCPQGRGTGL